MENTLKKRKELGQNWAFTSAPQSASQHSKSADWHPTRLRPFYPVLCFQTFHGSVLTSFSLKKKICNKVFKNLIGLLNWGI